VLTRWVNLVSGVPTVSNFSTTQGQGSPICVDTTTNLAYYLNAAGAVTMAQYFDNSVAYGINAVRIPGTQAAISAGDVTVYSMATLNSGTAAFPEGAGCSIDLQNFFGGGWFGGPTVNGRFEIHSYGTVTGWSFNQQPYMLNDPIWHNGNFNFQAVTKTAGYTEAATMGQVIAVCNLAGGFTVVLPTAVGNKAKFTFVKALAAGVITIDGAGTETINGALTATLNAQYPIRDNGC
jgi:hypothetical protein